MVCGTGAHTDDWHDLAGTSASLASALATSTGARVDVVALDDLPAAPSADLLVVNVSGDPDASRQGERDADGALDRLLAAHEAGIPMLAVHSAAYAFAGDPRWVQLLGGRWVPGVSGHPPIGTATVHPSHPIASEGEIVLVDERYTDLEVHDGSTVIATHDHDGVTHPLVWVRDDGPGRVAYSALGHDPRSHTSQGHRGLLARLVAWLTEGGPSPA